MRKAGVLPVEIDVEVAFHDVDLARIVWHGHYLKYLENARWALMDRLGWDLERMLESGQGWPIVGLTVKYLRMARYKDRLRIRAALVEWESRLVINYLVRDIASGERVARAQTTQVVVDSRTGEMQFALPPEFVSGVEALLGSAGGSGEDA